MRAKYQQLLIRFREDDPAHMEAWDYIHDMSTRNRSGADIIADLVKGKDRGSISAPASERHLTDMLSDVLHLCRNMDERISRGAFPPAGQGSGNSNPGQEENRSEAEVETGILDFALDMGD